MELTINGNNAGVWLITPKAWELELLAIKTASISHATSLLLSTY